MSNHKIVALILISINMLMLPGLAYSQKKCTAPELSEDQIHEIVMRERNKNDDIPRAFSKYEYNVKKQGCHYVYMENSLPIAFDNSQIFWLNQFGVIVNVQVGNSESVEIKCPDKEFSKSDLAEIIKKERKIRQNLPPSPSSSNYIVDVSRSGCLYFYFEYGSPDRRGNFQVFIIDPYGEFMDYSRVGPK